MYEMYELDYHKKYSIAIKAYTLKFDTGKAFSVSLKWIIINSNNADQEVS